MKGSDGDGRHATRRIDPSLGALEGEGAEQRAGGDPSSAPVPYEAWSPSAQASAGDDTTYYERPVLKEPVWIWAVPAYFYVGGAASASAILAEVVATLGRGDTGALVRRARRIAAAGGALATALLVYDLGRPSRFLNMLRVFRPSSPMSVGSWVLAAAAPAFVVSATLPHREGALGAIGNLTGKVSGVLGLPLAGYTSVLLSNTAVPVWQEARRELPYLFVSSAASSAASLLELTMLNDDEGAIVNRFGVTAQLAELASGLALERRVARIERVGRPLREGLSGRLWKTSTALTATTLVMSLLPGRSRVKRVVEGALGTIASVSLRFAVFEAGKTSARDPHATFQQQRRGHGAAELR